MIAFIQLLLAAAILLAVWYLTRINRRTDTTVQSPYATNHRSRSISRES